MPLFRSAARWAPAPATTSVEGWTGQPFSIRAAALTLVFVLAGLLALHAMRTFFLPIIVALMLYFVLSPVVRLLQKAWLPPSVAAAIVLFAVLGAIGYGAYRLTGPALEWTRELPQGLRRVEQRLVPVRESMQQVTRATAQVENLTKVDAPGPARVVAVSPPTLASGVWAYLRGFAASSTLAIVLLYFLLAGEDSLSRKLVELPPTISDKKAIVHTVRTVHRQISTYLMTITVINVVEGAAVGTALFLIGMPNPWLWGVMAGLLNFVPYLGPVIGVGVVAVVALLSFDSLGLALLAPALYLAVTSIEGLLTPLVLGIRFTMSPAVIFVWLMLWNWVWGIPGALIAVPMLVALKILADSTPPLAPLGRMLAR